MISQSLLVSPGSTDAAPPNPSNPIFQLSHDFRLGHLPPFRLRRRSLPRSKPIFFYHFSAATVSPPPGSAPPSPHRQAQNLHARWTLSALHFDKNIAWSLGGNIKSVTLPFQIREKQITSQWYRNCDMPYLHMPGWCLMDGGDTID